MNELSSCVFRKGWEQLGWKYGWLAIGFIGVTSVAHAFTIEVDPNTQVPLVPWTSTASGPRTANGQPATLTWSFVPDGTTISDGAGSLWASNLIAQLNTAFGGNPNQADLTQQPWFPIFQQSFGRWGQLGGATYIYEPNDSGGTHNVGNGSLGVRGDIRIGGAGVDGPGNVLAFNFLPTGGSDMVLDVNDMDDFVDPTNNFVMLRNVIMHEHGHGFGLLHVTSTTDNMLMEPAIDTSFDGPRLDEVRGIHFFFGDQWEKSHGGLGNGVAARATSLGSLSPGGSAQIGLSSVVPNQSISATATDFVSISNNADVDFFSFNISRPGRLSGTVTPRGGVFTQSGEGGTPTSFNANARSDLTLSILDTNGTTVVSTANSTGLGGSETVSNLPLLAAGQYYARVTGSSSTSTVQLYDLAINFQIDTTFTWLGGPGDWQDATRWSPLTGPPDTLQTAVINTGGTTIVEVTGSQTAANTQLIAGTLQLLAPGTLASPISISGGVLSGNGTVLGDVTNSGGTLSPGGATGTAGSGSAQAVPEPGTWYGALMLLGYLWRCRNQVA